MKDAEATYNEAWKSLAKLGEARIPGLTPLNTREASSFSDADDPAAVTRVDDVR